MTGVRRRMAGLHDKVLDVLGREIAAGDHPPGAVLRTEEMEQRFGISRSVAREVVRSHQTLPAILLVGDRGFTPGISGLVAGRLVETFRRPAVVMAIGDEFITASGRSIPEFDIFKAFTHCQNLFVRYGGHAQAAGFTLPVEKLPLLEAGLSAFAEAALGSLELRPALRIDAEVKLAELSDEARQWLAWLEPFGVANHQPVFLSRRVHVLETRYVGKLGQHLRLRIRDGNREWVVLAFNQAQHWTADPLLSPLARETAGNFATHPNIDLVYTLTTEHWQGNESLSLRALDLRLSI